MPTEFDVVVVGAGPAGAWTACRLARAGARVAVVDGSHPREKPCGGGLTGRALQGVGAAPPLDRVAGVAVGSARFEHRRQRGVVPLGEAADGPALLVTSR